MSDRVKKVSRGEEQFRKIQKYAKNSANLLNRLQNNNNTRRHLNNRKILNNVEDLEELFNRPKVGVALVIRNSKNKILFGPRVSEGRVGAGKLALPGGNLEYGESFEKSARKETEEETGLDIDESRMKFLHVTNNIINDMHYVTIFLECKLKREEIPEIIISKDPEEVKKHPSWDWYTLKELHVLANKGDIFDASSELIKSGKLEKLTKASIFSRFTRRSR